MTKKEDKMQDPGFVINYFYTQYMNDLVTVGGKEAKGMLYVAFPHMSKIAKNGPFKFDNFDEFAEEAHREIMWALFEGGGTKAKLIFDSYMKTIYLNRNRNANE